MYCMHACISAVIPGEKGPRGASFVLQLEKSAARTHTRSLNVGLGVRSLRSLAKGRNKQALGSGEDCC